LGRSHGIHAEPITAGLVFASFLQRGRPRATGAGNGARRDFSRQAGWGRSVPYASLDPESEIRALGALGLHPEVVPTQIVARDPTRANFMALARLGTAVSASRSPSALAANRVGEAVGGIR